MNRIYKSDEGRSHVHLLLSDGVSRIDPRRERAGLFHFLYAGTPGR